MTASSSGCTPLFLKAEPSSTGVIEMSSVAARIAAFSLSCSISSSARNASAISSSWSAIVSIMSWRYCSACSFSSAGISSSSQLWPSGST